MFCRNQEEAQSYASRSRSVARSRLTTASNEVKRSGCYQITHPVSRETRTIWFHVKQSARASRSSRDKIPPPSEGKSACGPTAPGRSTPLREQPHSPPPAMPYADSHSVNRIDTPAPFQPSNDPSELSLPRLNQMCHSPGEQSTLTPPP